MTSIPACCRGLPFSMVIEGAICGPRSRKRLAAFMIIWARMRGAVRDQILKPRSAASKASSSSARPATGKRPISASVAGFSTGKLSAVLRHWPSMKSCNSG